MSNIIESSAMRKANKVVNSISAVINTKDMTIQLTKSQGKNLNSKGSQNHSKKRKKSKNKYASGVNKFDKSGKVLIIFWL